MATLAPWDRRHPMFASSRPRVLIFLEERGREGEVDEMIRQADEVESLAQLDPARAVMSGDERCCYKKPSEAELPREKNRFGLWCLVSTCNGRAFRVLPYCEQSILQSFPHGPQSIPLLFRSPPQLNSAPSPGFQQPGNPGRNFGGPWLGLWHAPSAALGLPLPVWVSHNWPQNIHRRRLNTGAAAARLVIQTRHPGRQLPVARA